MNPFEIAEAFWSRAKPSKPKNPKPKNDDEEGTGGVPVAPKKPIPSMPGAALRETSYEE